MENSMRTMVRDAIHDLLGGEVARVVTETRAKAVLGQLAQHVATMAADQALLSLRTLEEVAEQVGVSYNTLRKRALRRNIGWRAGTGRRGIVLLRPQDVTLLQEERDAG